MNKENAQKLKNYQESIILLEESTFKYNEIKQENETMKQSISELNALVDEKREEIEAYTSLLKQIKPFQDQYHELQSSHRLILDEYHEFKKQSSQKNNNLIQDLETMNTASNQLELSLKHSDHIIESKSNEIEALTNRIKEISTNNESEIKNINQNHENELSELYQKINYLSQELEALTESNQFIESAANEICDLKNANDSLQETIKQLNSKKNAALNQIDVYKHKISSLQQQKDAVQSKFAPIIIKNTNQYNEIIELKKVNCVLKDEMVSCDAHITRLKDSILSKFKDLDKKYAQKMDEIKELQHTLVESNDLGSKCAQKIREINDANHIIKELQNEIISKNKCIESMQLQMKEMESKHEAQNVATHNKLGTLSTVIGNKLKLCADIIRSKDMEIKDLCSVIQDQTQEINRFCVEQNNLRQFHQQQMDDKDRKISSFQSKSNQLMAANAEQYKEIIELKQEMKCCDAQITRLKECIISKFKDLDSKYTQKMDEVNYANNMAQELKHDLLVKQTALNQSIEALENVISKVNASYTSDIAIYKEQIDHSEQIIRHNCKEIQELKDTINQETKRNSFLSEQITQISEDNECKIRNMNENHEKELKELNSMLDALSNEFNSLRSSTNNSPQKNNEDALDQQLTFKVQEIKIKLKNRFTKQKDKHKLAINGLNYKIKKLQQINKENAQKLKKYIVLLEESNFKYCETKQNNETMKQSISELNALVDEKRDEIEAYTSLLKQIKPFQDRYHKLQSLHRHILDEYHELKRKYNLMLRQCLFLSKLNYEIQTENIELVDRQLLLNTKYKESQQKHNELCHYLFYRTLIASCYYYKCDELQNKIISLQKDKEQTQTDLMAQRLDVLELNDEIRALNKYKEELESNKTGLMLESLHAQDTINELIEINKKLESDTNVNTAVCNDPIHEETIASLKKKFSLMCLNMEKAHIESFDHVQKAVSLRDENMKLKKQNRKICREIKHLQNELQETKSRIQDWSLSTSCAESIQSNHGIYDEEGNTMNVEDLKMKMEDDYTELNDAQSNIFKYTNNSMNVVHERLNVCLHQMQQLKMKQNGNREKEETIKGVMLQMMDLSEKVTNEMREQCDGILSVFEIRCDGVSQNVRLIKHALDNKENEENQLKLEHQNEIERHLYDLQFTMKITRKTFQNEMMENIKYAMYRYDEEYKQTQIMVSKAFELTMERMKQSLNVKNAKIYELESLLFQKRDQFKNKIKLNKNDYKELKSVNDRLQKDLFQQHKLIKEIYAKKEVMNDEMNELKQENNSLKIEITTLKGIIITNNNDSEQKGLKFEALNEEKDELMIKIHDLQQQISELHIKLNVSQSNQERHSTTTQKQKEELIKLKDVLNETQKERDKYYNDKELMQREIKLVTKQLDEHSIPKTRLETQMEQLIEFQLREKMDESLQMTAVKQQRIQELELAKSKLELEIQNLCLENSTFKFQNKQQREDKQTHVKELLQTITLLKEEKQTVMHEMERLMHKYDTKIIRLNEKFDEEITLKDGIIKKVNTKTDGLEKDIEVYKGQIDHSLHIIECKNQEIKNKDKEHFDAIQNLQNVIETQQTEAHEKLLFLEKETDSIQSKYTQLNAANITQYNEMIKLKEVNDSLKHEMVCCDTQIAKLKDCIITKFNDLNKAYNEFEYELKRKERRIQELKNNKRDELNDTNNLMKEMKKMKLHNAMKQKHDILQEHKYAEKIDLIKDLEHKLISKNESISSLNIKMNEMKYKHNDEKTAIRFKLDVLSMVIRNKLSSFSEIIQNKDIEIEEVCYVVTNQRKEIDLMKDEIEVLKHNKSKLERDISELNRNLLDSHSKHQSVKQTHKQGMTHTKNVQQQLSVTKHKNVEMHRYHQHIKEKCDGLESQYKRYKNKFKSAQTECVLLRKKTSVLDQLLRLVDNELGELQFDNKSGNVREKMMSDWIEREHENDSSLYKAHHILLEIKSMKNDWNDYEDEDEDKRYRYYDMKQRMDDLKAEFHHYKEILKLNDENNMEFKQQTAFYTHQILEHWQKIFNKLIAMIDVKSHIIEALQNSVSEVMLIKDEDVDLAQENDVNEMKMRMEVLETKHRHEMMELKGLFEKEVNVYKSKLQSLNQISQENVPGQNDLIYKGENRDNASNVYGTINDDGYTFIDHDICPICHQQFKQIPSKHICFNCDKDH